MAEQYYIRRGDQVVGPVGLEQLRQNIANGKIVASDMVATSPDGPWQPVGQPRRQSPQAEPQAQAPVQPQVPVQPAPAQQVPVQQAPVQQVPVQPLAAAPQMAAAAAPGATGYGTAPSPVTRIGDSQVSIDGRPSFAHLRIQLAPGETIIGEADAMASMAGVMDMKAKLNGGFFSGLCKKFLGGESMFVNHFTNETDHPLPLVLAPSTPGDIRQLTLSGDAFCLQPGAFIACTPGVKLGTKWAGLASLIGREGLFKLQVSGTGTVWYGAFGSLLEREIDGQYIVDTGHLVGYEPQMKLKVQLAGGIFSSFFEGEGLVTRVEGKGKIIIQTRSLGGLASWLNPFLPG